MPVYPYDPTTGNRLMKNGCAINALQPMTQAEVDMQCDSDKFRSVREAPRECIIEIKHYHDKHHSKCMGACPSRVTIQMAEIAIKKLENMS